MTVAPRAESTIVDANNPTPDPFVAYRRQDTPYTVLEVMKTTLTSLSLFPVRLGIFSFVAVTSCLAATILTAGVDPGNPMAEPLSPIRRRLMRFVCWYAGAGGCLAFGIYVNTTKTVKLDRVPLIVANHLSYIDVLVLMKLYQPSFVAKYGVRNVPVIGAIAKTLHCLFVSPPANYKEQNQGQSSTTPTISVSGVQEITRRSTPSDLPPLVIFPEGTTTNGVEMVSFRTGVFRCKAPVTPVCLRYPNKHYSLSWETVPITTHVWRLMTQFVNFVEVIPLDEYKPSQEELADAYLYADNVQKMMAEVMECGYSTTTTREHKVAYHDSILGNLTYDQALARAKELTKAEAKRRHSGDGPMNSAANKRPYGTMAPEPV